MSGAATPTPEHLLRTYFHAKDENRPHLMASVFSATATLEVVVKSGTISFPPVSQGIDEISKVLGRQFSQTYDNVYSFYLQRPPRFAERFSCDWLVGMSEKASGAPCVGCGRYDWVFERQAPFLVDRLAITIETMQGLDRDHLPAIMEWMTSLPYPWCDGQSAVGAAPRLEALAPVLAYLGR